MVLLLLLPFPDPSVLVNKSSSGRTEVRRWRHQVSEWSAPLAVSCVILWHGRTGLECVTRRLWQVEPTSPTGSRCLSFHSPWRWCRGVTMKTLAAAALLVLSFCATGERRIVVTLEQVSGREWKHRLLHFSPCLFSPTVSGDEDTETAVTAQPGDVALLPCYTAGNVTPSLTTWIKDGREIVRGGGDSTPSPSAGTQRLAVLQDGRLNITQVVRGDEGIYLCTILLPGNNIYHGRVQLQVTSEWTQWIISAHTHTHMQPVQRQSGFGLMLSNIGPADQWRSARRLYLGRWAH